MKSSLATIGETDLSETAAKLEAAAKSGDSDYCRTHCPPFNDELAALQERLTSQFADKSGEPPAVRKPGDPGDLSAGVEKALAAADEFESELGAEVLRDLLKYDFGDEVNEKLKEIKAAFDDFDCPAAAEMLETVL
jgi:hypothetical protein